MRVIYITGVETIKTANDGYVPALWQQVKSLCECGLGWQPTLNDGQSVKNSTTKVEHAACSTIHMNATFAF